MSSNLALHFLGSPQLYLNKTLVSVERRKAVALLAYLAIERGQHQRDLLSSLFWPDYEQSKAFANLRHTLWEVQKAIGEGWINADRDQIGLNQEADIWLDVTDFESLIENRHTQTDTSLRISLLADAAKLYRNHFLTGFSLKDAYPFNEWAYAVSEDLRLKLATTLTTLSEDLCSEDQAEKAVPYARRLITLDPLNEASHRILMNVYIQARQHSAALKQYQTLEQTLRKELNLDPQPETRELYKKIRKGDRSAIPVTKATEIITPEHNLPHQISSFIGREKEMAEVSDLITNNRLVTLIGTGGIGKTRVSLQLGHKLLNEYPDGVWFIEFDSLSTPDLVTQTVASVFDIRESSNRPIIEILTNILHDKSVLLIFDNCEHLLDACAELATTLLSQCPKLKILVTSREILNITGEAIYQMPSLSLPEQDEVSLKKLSEYESVRLFSERATLSLSSFSLTNENAHTVMNICRRVDGIPLGIELAAAHVNILQVKEILKQLNNSFALLANDSRTTSTHHQTLRASMDWSWGLLNESEQTFLEQLSVFVGGWTFEAAQSVCDGEILDLTNSLVKKSLILVKQDEGRETRYRFHQFVRQYMQEKLIESGKETNIRDQHLKYFLDLSEKIHAGLTGPDHLKWLIRANDDRDNIRSALRHALNVDVEAGLFISGRLEFFWHIIDHSEGVRWLTKFLQSSKSKEYPLARAGALLCLGILLSYQEQFSRSHAIVQECLDLYRELGNQEGEADALILIGYALQSFDKREEANVLYEQSLTLARSIDDPGRQAMALYSLGSDRPAVQLSYWDEAIILYRKAGDVRKLANLLYLTARIHILLTGSIEKAQKYLEEATQLFPQKSFSDSTKIWAKYATSMIATMQGNHEEAYEQLQKVMTTAKETGYRAIYLWTRAFLGYVAIRMGNLTEARQFFTETAKEFQQDQNTIGVVYALEGMASVYIALGNPKLAAQLIGWADSTRERIINERPFLEQTDVDKTIAAIMAKIGSTGFEVAYDEGWNMSLEKVVELSLWDD